MFDSNQETFQQLFCSKLKAKGDAEIHKVIGDVFGNSPSQKNLSKFFNNDIVKAIWWGHEQYTGGKSFYESDALK